MRGAYFQYIQQKGIGRYTDAVEEIKAREAEAAESRLARIQNGAEPSHRNGTRECDCGAYTPATRTHCAECGKEFGS